MVKTQCRWLVLTILNDIAVVRLMEYLLPQEGQKRLLQVKGTNLNLPHFLQPYTAPPLEGSPQEIILSMLSMTESRGCRRYLISS